jgi:hypothetical protein
MYHIALVFIQGPYQGNNSPREASVLFAGLTVVIRPTSAVLWIFLAVVHLLCFCADHIDYVIECFFPACMLALWPVLILDRYVPIITVEL